MTLHCQDALPLVPSYLDGELSEAQASLLRKHLLSCHPCRGSVQDGKALKRWFAPESNAGLVPSGFAARVARRAFAGDMGQSELAADAELATQDRGRLLQFVLRLTAVAAAAMLVLGVALRSQELPSGSALRADDRVPRPWAELEKELERLNAPAATAPANASAAPASEAAEDRAQPPARPNTTQLRKP